MSLETKRELTVAIKERYRAADRKSKIAMLDEFAKVTGYHRKHAIRVLRKGKPVVERKPVGKRIYQEAVEESLIGVWEPIPAKSTCDIQLVNGVIVVSPACVWRFGGVQPPYLQR